MVASTTNLHQLYMDPIKYTDPCLYANNLLLDKLSSIYGNITYANGASTPLSDITVTLTPGGAFDVTDAGGNYNISGMIMELIL